MTIYLKDSRWNSIVKNELPVMAGVFLALVLSFPNLAQGVESICPGGTAPSPNVLWCDDFEDMVPLNQKYFQYDSAGGSFIPVQGQGVGGSVGMQATWQSAQVSAGSFIRTFGRSPVNSQSNSNTDFNEIYWRLYLKEQSGWTGNSYKLTRATIFASSNWAQAMIAHVWGDGTGDTLIIDPASGINSNGNLVTTQYNDFANLTWLGLVRGSTPIFNQADSGVWHCIESHVKLNSSGASNGIFEFWIDNNLEASRTDLNWVGTWTGFGVNAVFFENYWNGGAPGQRIRYIDNLVVSTQRIGCLASVSPPSPPSGLKTQ